MHSLKGGKVILLKSDGSEGEVVKAKSKCFRIGSFLSCDLVLDDAEAKEVHCDINRDAFGRITITNHCKRNPVKVNGLLIKGTRNLYNNSKIEIFGKQFQWEFNNKNAIAKRNNDPNSTPQNHKRAEQAPNSAPTLRTTKHQTKHTTTMKRITMHNLAQNPDLSTDSETDADEQNQHNLKKLAVVSATTSSGVTPPRTPRPRTSGIKIRRQTIDCSTPVRVTPNQPQASTNIIKNITPKMKLLKCTQSPLNIISYSPDVKNSKNPKSLDVVKPNAETPGSIYGTPNSVFSDVDGNGGSINLQSPNTPKPQTSMYLINLSTPENMKTPVAVPHKTETPLLRSALKNSAKSKQLAQNKRKTRFSLLTEEYDPELSIRSTKALKDENSIIDSSPINRVKKSLQLESPTSSTVFQSNQFFKEAEHNNDIINKSPEKTPLKIVNLSENQRSAVKALRASLLIKGKFDTPNKSSTPIAENRMGRRMQSPGVENVFEELTLEGQESCNENESKNTNSLKDNFKNTSNTKNFNTSEKSISQINIPETSSRNTTKKNFIELNKDVSRYAKGKRLSLNKSLPVQRKSIFSSRPSLNKTDISLAKKELLLKTITDNKVPESSKLYTTSSKTPKLQIDKLSSTSIRNEVNDLSKSKKMTPLNRLSTCKTPCRLLTNNSRNSMNANKSRRSLSLDSSVNKSQQIVTSMSSSILQKTPVKQNNVSLSKRRQSICLTKTHIKQGYTSDSISEKDRASTPVPKSGTLADRLSLAMNTSINTSQEQLENISTINSQEIPVKESFTILTESSTKESVSTLSPATTKKENISLKGNSILLPESKDEHSSPLRLPSKQSMSLTKSSLRENCSLSESTVKQSENMLEPLENTDQCTVQDLNVTFTEDNDNNASDNLEDPENNITNLTFSIDSDDDDNNVNDFVDKKIDVSSVTNQPNQSLRISNAENGKAVDNYMNFLDNIHRHDQINESSSEISSTDLVYNDNLNLDSNKFPISTPDISIRTEARLLEEDISDLPTEKSTTNPNSSIDKIQERDDNLLNSPEHGDVSNSIEGLYITPKSGDNSKDLKTPVVVSLSGFRKSRRSCRNDLTNVVGVKELLKTPENQKDPSLLGVKELLKTPKPSSISETLVGVKELMKTPKNNIDISDNIKGVRDLYNTPARDDITDVRGVKELMKTPVLRTPKLFGVKELMKTPETATTNFVGVKELLKTPKPITTNLVGVKELMKTPKILSFADDYDGLENVFKTPASRMVMVLGSPKSANITRDDRSSNNHLLKTPGDYDLQEDMVGVEALFKTPRSKFMSNIEKDMDSGESTTSSADAENKINKTTSTSIEVNRSVNIIRNAFDLIASTPEKPEICRTYSRIPDRCQIVFPIPFAEISKSPELPTTDVQKWVDSTSATYKAVEDEEDEEEEEIYDVEDSADSVLFTNQSIKSVIGKKIQLPATVSSNKKTNITGKIQDSKNALNFSQVSGIAMIDDSTTDIAASTPEPEEEPLVEEEEEELFIDLVEEEDIQKSDSNIEIILDSTTESSACINISEQTNASDVEYIDFISDGRPSTRKTGRQTPKKKSLTPAEETVTSEKKIDSSSSSIVSRLREKSQTPLRNKVIKANARKTRAESVKSTNEMEKLTGKNVLSQERTLRSRSQTPYKKLPQTKELDRKSIMNVTSEDIKVIHSMTKTPEKIKGRTSRQIIASTPVSTVLSKTQNGINSSLRNFSTMPGVCLRRGRSLAPGQAIPIGGHSEKKSRKTLGVTPNHNKSVNVRRGRSSSLYMTPDKQYISNEYTGVENSFTSTKSIEPDSNIEVTNDSNLDIQNMNQDPENNDETHQTLMFPENNVNLHQQDQSTSEDKKGKNVTESRIENNNRKSLTTDSTTNLEIHHTENVNDKSFKNQSNELVNKKDVTLVQSPLKQLEGSLINIENHEKSFAQSEANTEIDQNHHKMLGKTPTAHDASESFEIESEFKNFNAELITTTRSRGRSLSKSENVKDNSKISRKTLGHKPSDEDFNVEAAKEQYEHESQFKNFSDSPIKGARRGKSFANSEELIQNNKNSRKTLGHKPIDEDFDVEAAKEQYEFESQFKNFSDSPIKGLRRGRSFEPSESEDLIQKIKVSRKTLGQNLSDKSFDAEAVKQQFETESQFKNFSAVPIIGGPRRGRSFINSDNQTDVLMKSRKTLGEKPSDESFDPQAAKKQYEMDVVFKDFGEKPRTLRRRGKSFASSVVYTEIKKDSRKTLGQNPSESFDAENAKEQYDLEIEFKNFSEKPIQGKIRGKSLINSENMKNSAKMSRKTLGHKPSDDDFDVEAAKEQYELDSQFKNFSDSPIKFVRRGRSFVNSEDQVQISKVSRKTMGHKPSDEDFDVEAAKEQYELESQFANFSDSPIKGVRRGRSFINSEDQVQISKVSRKTMGHKPSDEDFDVEAAKEQYELESQFANFSDSPIKGVRRGRSFINSEDQVQISKVSRKTMGHKPSDEDFDVEAAKEQYELESQFANFSDSPIKGVRRGRSFINSEDQVQISKVSRKTMGHKPSDEDFDVEVAKEQYELESQFANFSDSPIKGVRRGRSFINSEDQVQISKVSRKTMGHKPSDEDFDVEAAKEQYELESQFANFSDSPIKGVRRGRSFINSEDQVQISKVSRKTMGHKPSDEDFDVEVAKEQYELESQFANFSDSPIKGVRRGRSFINSEDQVHNIKDSRKTMGHMPSDEDFNVQAAKEKYEFECQFKNFNDLPNKGARRGRSFVNFENQVQNSKNSRKTVGHKPSDEDFDVEVAKEQYELESQFKNFSDLPVKGVRRGRSFFSSEDQIENSKVSRKTMGHKPSDEDFDIEMAKEQYELESQFKNFSYSPIKGVRRGRSFINSEDQVHNSKFSRKTMGHMPSDEDFNVEAAKEKYEFECQFKNFNDLPNKGARRGKSFVNFEDLSQNNKISRKTLGHEPSNEDFDVQAAKEQYELEIQFKNFSDSPIKGRRGRSLDNSGDQVQHGKDSRKTMGHNPSDGDFDVAAVKEQYELECQFKNFNDLSNKAVRRGKSYPNSEDLVQNRKVTRKSLGHKPSSEDFDVEAAKEQYDHESQHEVNIQFKDFVDQPQKRHSDNLEVSTSMQPSLIVVNQNSKKLVASSETNKEHLPKVTTLSAPSLLQSIENQNNIKLNKSITPINSKKLDTTVPQEISNELSDLNAAETIDKPKNTEKENIVQTEVHQNQPTVMPARRKRRLYSKDIEYDNIVAPIVRTYEVKIRDDSAQVVFKPQLVHSDKKSTRGKQIILHDEMLAQLSAIAEAREKTSELPTSDTTEDISGSEKTIDTTQRQTDSLFQSETEITENLIISEDIGKKSSKFYSNTANEEESAQQVRRGSRKRVPPASSLTYVAPKTKTNRTGRGKKIEEPIITVVEYENTEAYPSILKNRSSLENEDKDKKKVVFNDIVSQHTIPIEEAVSPEKIVQPKERKRGRSTRGKNISSSELLETEMNLGSTIAKTPKTSSTRKTGGRVKLSELTSSLSGTPEAEVENERKEEIATDVIVPKQNRATRRKQIKETILLEIGKEIIASTSQEPLEIPLSETETMTTIPDEVESTPPNQNKGNLKSTKTRERKSKKDKEQEAKLFLVPPSDDENEHTEDGIVSNEKLSLNQDVTTESSINTNKEEILSKKMDKKIDLKTTSKRGRKLTKKPELDEKTSLNQDQNTESDKTDEIILSGKIEKENTMKGTSSRGRKKTKIDPIPADLSLNSNNEKSDGFNSEKSNTVAATRRGGRSRQQPIINSDNTPLSSIEGTPQIAERRPKRGRKAVEKTEENPSVVIVGTTLAKNEPVDDKAAQSQNSEFKTPQSIAKSLTRTRRLRSGSIQQDSPIILGNISVNTSTPQSINKVTRRLRSNSVTDSSVIETNSTMEEVPEPDIKSRRRNPALDCKNKISTETEPMTTKPKRRGHPRKILEEEDKTPEKKVVVKRTRRGAKPKSENFEIDTTSEKDQSQPEDLVLESQSGDIENLEESAKEPETPFEKLEDLAKEPEAPSKRPTRGKRKNYQEVEIEEVTKENARPKRTRRKV